VRAGHAIPGQGEIVIDHAFARRAGVGLGDTVTLAGHALTVSGITDDTNLLVTQYCFVALRDLVAAVGLGDIASFFLVRAAPGWGRDLARRVESRIDGVAAFDRETFIANNREEIESGFLPVLWAIALLGLVVGGSIVAIMTYAAVLEKREDYVLLAAIGAGAAVRFSVVLQQAMVAAVTGGIVGVGALVVLQSTLPMLVPELQLRLEAWICVLAIVGAMAMAAAGAVIPGRVATRFAPLEALRR
jgi:predicted lysophospholipase L1 biosynthesis ABC-type transport system permease subunit